MQVWMSTPDEAHWLVGPSAQKPMLQLLSAQGISYEVDHHDIGSVINDQKISMMAANYDVDKDPMEDYWDNYRDYDEQIKFMHRIARMRPDICKVVKMGKTSEGRWMYVLQIGEARNKPMCYNQVSMSSAYFQQ